MPVPGSSRTRTRTRTDTGTLAVIGVICAIAGFFVLGIILGPVAAVCGWLAMGRAWTGAKPIPAVVALVLGVIDTLVALLWLTGAGFFGGLGLVRPPQADGPAPTRL